MNHTRRSNVGRMRLASLFAYASFAAVPGLAQSSGDDLFDIGIDELEHIIVYAQKREEALHEVPIAINALGGEDLYRLHIQDTDDIVRLYPNLSLQSASSVNTGFTIRGVGTSNWHITAQQAVGQYIDEVSLSGPYTSTLTVYDMERIEVLRGPQNALFGRNTTGGAVNYITRKPKLDDPFGGYLSAGLGNSKRVDLEGAVAIPVNDRVALRLAGQKTSRDGLFDNLYNGQDLGDLDRWSSRGQLLWQVNPRSRVLFNLHLTENDSGRTPFRSVGVWDPNGANIVNGIVSAAAINTAPIDCPSTLRGGSDQFQGTNACLTLEPFSGGATTNPSTRDWHDVYETAPDRASFDNAGGYLRIDHERADFSLTSITAYDVYTSEYVQTLTGIRSGNGFMPGQSGDNRIFSQELRVTSATDRRIRWIAGAFYSRENSELATIIYRYDEGGAPFGIVPSISIDQTVDIWSGYGQLEYDVGERGTLTVGVRFSDDERDGTSIARVAAKTSNGTFPVASGLGTGAPLGFDSYLNLDSFDRITAGATSSCPPAGPANFPCRNDIPISQNLAEWGGKIGYDFRVAEDLMTYVSYARGFKSGAFDTRALAAFQGNADQPTDPEYLDAYEVGIKSRWPSHNVQLSAAAFFYRWDDLQTFDVDATGAVAFLNIPEAEIVGAEIELVWHSDDGLSIQSGFGYLHTEITDKGDLVTPVRGASLPGAPARSFTTIVTKALPLRNGTLHLQTDFSWMDERQSSSTAGDRIRRLESQQQINARVSYRFGHDDRYEIALWGHNLTGEEHCRSLELNGPLNYQLQCIPNDGQMMWGANARLNF